MKRIISYALAGAIILCFSGCAAAKNSSGNVPAVPEETLPVVNETLPQETPEQIQPTEAPGQTSPRETAVPSPENGDEEYMCEIFVEPVIERFLAQRDDHIFYDDAPGSEYAQKLVFTTNSNLSKLTYFRFNADITEEGKLICAEKEELFSLGKFTSNDLLVINLVFEGTIPNEGMSYVDENGNTHNYYLTESGENGMPLIVKFPD